MINYKYNEDDALKEIKSYIDSTYTQHYSGKYQATDMIIDAGHGTGFCIGNIMKYAKRYGKKDGFNKKDLLKIIHYAIIQLYTHNQEKNKSQSKDKLVKITPESNSVFAIDYKMINNNAYVSFDPIGPMSIMTCYKNNVLDNLSSKCSSCDCWKSSF